MENKITGKQGTGKTSALPVIEEYWRRILEKEGKKEDGK